MRKCILYGLNRRFSERLKSINNKKIDTSLEFYKKLRIYKDKSAFGLFNSKVVWMACERDIIVDNGEQLYKMSSSILGSKLTNFVMSNTMGKQFTAGHDTQDLRKTVLNLNSIGFGAMIDYLAELKPGVEVPESEFDWNCQKIELAIRETHINDNNSFALKLSALCNLDALKKSSAVQDILDKLFNPDHKSPKMEITYNQLKENLTNSGIEFTDKEFNDFVSLIRMSECDKIRKDNNCDEMLSIVEWRVNLGCFN